MVRCFEELKTVESLLLDAFIIIDTYINTYIHVTKTVGSGRSHKYTNIYNSYSIKYFKLYTPTLCTFCALSSSV